MRKTIIFTGNFFFRVTCILVLLANMYVLCVYAYLRFTTTASDYVVPIQLDGWQKIALPVSILVFLISGLILYRPKKEKQTAISSKRILYRRIFTLTSIALFIFLQLDSRPPEEVYSISSITSDDAKVTRSQPYLNEIYHGKNDKDDKIPDLRHIREEGGYAIIEAYSSEIESAWQGIGSQRGAVRLLAGYGSVLHEVEEYLVYNPITLRRVGFIYQAHILITASQGDLRSAVNDLVFFQKTIRKGLGGCVSLLQKMVWVAAAGENLRTAFQLASEYTLSQDQLKTLAEEFGQLSREEESFYKAWIGEYLSLKTYIGFSYFPTVEAHIYKPEEYSTVYRLAKKLPEPLVDFLYQLLLHENRTAWQLQAFWTPIIEKSREGIVELNVVDIEEINSSLSLRNIGGAWFHQRPQYLAYGSRMVDLQTRYQLFTAFLKSEISSQPGQSKVEEGEMLRDIGKDAKSGTDDDIVLKSLYPVHHKR